MARKPSPRFVPAVLALEDRSVPAGDVTANILTDPDGFRTLSLQGDTADNRVTVRQLPNGLVQVHGVTTTINGGKGVVTFANVDGLAASFSTGNDTVRTMNLRMQTVSLDGGFGDDDLAMLNTTLSDGIRDASLFVYGDPDTVYVPPDTLVNGRDKIDLTGTRISSGGSFYPIVVYGDSIEDLDTHDDIRLTDTRLTFHGDGNHEVEIYGGFYGESRGTAGDTITVTNFRSETVGGGEFSGSGVNVYGSSGDDAIRFAGIDLTVLGTGGSNNIGPNVYGGGGFDRFDATDVTISATGPADSYQYFLPGFRCEDVRFRDWDVAITSQFDESGWFFLLPFQPSFYGVHNLELHDVRMTTPEGGGFVTIDSVDPFTGEDGFAANILFDNVQIEQEVESPFGLTCLYESFSGDDTVRILNSRLPYFGVLKYGTDGSADVLIEGSELDELGLTLGEWDYLAEANDTVRIRNTTIRDSMVMLTYGGNDAIEVSDSMFGGRLDVEGGAGDDDITVSGCTFSGSPEIRISGDAGLYGASYYSAAGNDTIRVRNCTLDAQDPDGVGVFASVLIGGDVVNEPSSTFVGGNDVIEVSDFTATVSSTADYSDLFFSVYGESVESGATLIGGHDDITLRNVTLNVTGVGPTSSATVILYVTGGAISGDSTLVGSNDTIRVRDVSVVSDGATDSNFGFSSTDVQIVGSEFYRDYFSDDLPTLVGGNDVIEVTNGYFRSSGGVFANFAGEFSYYDMSVTGGNDVITLTDVATISGFGQSLSVSGEAGQLVNSSGLADTITMTNVSAVHILEDGVEFGDAELYVSGGEGDNRITLVNVTTDIVGTPLDSYEVMEVTAGDGNDVVSIRKSGSGGNWLFVWLGEGNDTLTVADSTFATARVFLGDGDDTADMVGCQVGEMVVHAGGGDDALTVRESSFISLAADLGDGDDTAVIENNTATVSISVSGGAGWDTLVAWGNIAPDLFFDDFEA